MVRQDNLAHVLASLWYLSLWSSSRGGRHRRCVRAVAGAARRRALESGPRGARTRDATGHHAGPAGATPSRACRRCSHCTLPWPSWSQSGRERGGSGAYGSGWMASRFGCDTSLLCPTSQITTGPPRASVTKFLRAYENGVAFHTQIRLATTSSPCGVTSRVARLQGPRTRELAYE